MCPITTCRISTIRKIRDVVRKVTVKSDKRATYIIIGVENQSDIHYAMPIRNMLYDALRYSSQVTELAKMNKEHGKLDSNSEFLSGMTKEDRLLPVITLVINWSKDKWDAPIRLSEMLVDTPKEYIKFVNDYSINLVDPHAIEDFDKFHSELGDVLEFIKRQNEDDYLIHMQEEKKNGWELSVDSVNTINTFTGANISLDSVEEGKMNMCRATEALVELGIEKGTDLSTIDLICKKIQKGKDIETIADEIEKEVDEVEPIFKVAMEFAPDYDVNAIYDAIKKK